MFSLSLALAQIATLGPASRTFEQIEKLFLAGVDVFRLNFSHGAHEEKADVRDVSTYTSIFLYRVRFFSPYPTNIATYVILYFQDNI